jgi:hypothetical protein
MKEKTLDSDVLVANEWHSEPISSGIGADV